MKISKKIALLTSLIIWILYFIAFAIEMHNE